MSQRRGGGCDEENNYSDGCSALAQKDIGRVQATHGVGIEISFVSDPDIVSDLKVPGIIHFTGTDDHSFTYFGSEESKKSHFESIEKSFSPYFAR